MSLDLLWLMVGEISSYRFALLNQFPEDCLTSVLN